MARTDDLMAEYLDTLSAVDKQARIELDQVRAKLEALAPQSMRTWLGDEVMEELSPAEYGFVSMGGSYDYDAMLKVSYFWREHVRLELGIIARRVKPKMRSLTVEVELVAALESGGGQRFYCKLPTGSLLESVSDESNWEFYVADHPASKNELARFFLGCRALLERREKEIAETARYKAQRERNLWEYEIMDAADDASLLAKHQAAVEAMPDYAAAFDTARDARRAVLIAEAEGKQLEENELVAAVDWIRTWKAARDQNLARLAQLVAELQQPIKCWSLVFAIQADGLVETGSIYVRDPQPDADGFWISIEGSRPYRTRVNYPVRVIEEMFDFDEAPAILRNSVFVSECLFHLKFPATMDPIEVLGELTHIEFVELPEAGSWGHQVFQKAIDRVNELSGDDISTLWAYHNHQYEQY